MISQTFVGLVRVCARPAIVKAISASHSRSQSRRRSAGASHAALRSSHVHDRGKDA